MSLPNKRYCIKCELERPIEDFLRNGELPKNDHNICTREHISHSPIKAKRKARKIAKKSRRKAYPVVSHRLRDKRRRQSVKNTSLLADGLTKAQYMRYLESIHWKKFTEAYKEHESLLQKCYVCGDSSFKLYHHNFERFGNELIEDVVPLCDIHRKAVLKAVKSRVKLGNAHTYVKMCHKKD